MNDRIVELKRQCWEDRPYGPAWFNADKFAELIVNECAAYLNGAMEVHNQAEQDLCDHAARKIKQHFGIEK